MGNPNAISLGPGTLRIAALGSTEPTDLVSAWPAAWTALGYTHEGNTWSYQLNVEQVEVAEELDPLRYVPTGRVIQVKFILAEITATNLQRSLNGGTIVAGSGFVTFEPPAFGTETRKMFGWESDDVQERWVFRQCLSSGSVEASRKKGADKAGLPFELNCEKPAGVQPFKVIFASPARA
jgi:hypothetical protein